MILIFLGPPGSGKGTQAKKLTEYLNIPQLSTGDMLRAAISAEKPIGKKAKEFIDAGKLVPDSVVIDLIADRSGEADCKKGFILDGFPRTVAQADSLTALLALNDRRVGKVISFNIADEILVGRLTGRRTCQKCGAMYHIQDVPPKVEGICDRCGGALYQRSDDTKEVISKRLETYKDQTRPLIDYYKNHGILEEVNANQPVEKLFTLIKGMVGKP